MMLTSSHRSSSQILSKVQEQDTSEMETSDKVHCTTHQQQQPAGAGVLCTTTNILDSHS